MECQECDSIIHDFMRAGEASEETRAMAFDHIMRCERCEVRFSNVRSLERALRSLAETMDSERSAAQMEPSLRTVFQQQNRVRRRSRSIANWVAVGMAASILLGVGIVSRYWIFTPVNKPVISSVLKPVQPPEISTAQVPEQIAKLPQKIRNHRKPKPNVSTQHADNKEFVTGFYALPYAEGSDRVFSGEIIRVKLRGSALPAIGFPVTLNGDQAEEQITADLFVGENGLPLAIRFVR